MKMFAKALIFLPLAFLAGCLPDLTIKKGPELLAWNGGHKVSVDIKNRGWANAGPFLVYFDAERGTSIRSQVMKKIPGLKKRTSINLKANFDIEGSPSNANLAYVEKITVRVDAKDMVKESNEKNNIGVVYVP